MSQTAAPDMLGTWEVVDRWWTGEPVRRSFRIVRTEDGRRIVQVSDDGSPWQYWGDE